MDEHLWTEIDGWLDQSLGLADPALDLALAASEAAGLQPINVAANQGKMLNLLARSAGARRILEIGTLGGYSTIWLARALPEDGGLITLEADPVAARVAQSNLEQAGLGGKVQVRLGPALDTLPHLVDERAFDFVFIDADKPNYPAYLDWAVKLTRLGGLIVADNVVRGGAVIRTDADERAQGTRRFLEQAAADPRLDVTALQTVGAKGHDGFALALKTAD